MNAEDLYIQQAVRLENLKEGEARRIVRMLRKLQEDTLQKLANVSPTAEWTAKKYAAMNASYGNALDTVFSKQIMPSLDESGLAFTAKNTVFHQEALVFSKTGVSPAAQKAAAKALGLDVANPFYRGSKAGNLTGQFYSPSKEYAEGYASGVFESARTLGVELGPEQYKKISKSKVITRDSGANIEKVYLPKKGRISLNNKELAGKFDKWLEKQGILGGHVNFIGATGELKYSERELMIQFLKDEKMDWSLLQIDENTKNDAHKLSIFTKDENVAKSVYSDFAGAAGSTQKIGASIVSTNLSPEMIYQAANAKPMQGKLMKAWATQLVAKDKQLVSGALRNSWLEGESIQSAVKNLRPVFARTNRDLAAITRTFYGHLAAESRDSVWKANSDLIQGITWDSILDERTTFNICAPRDQKKYTMKGEPIGHSLPYMGGPGQAHWQCRSHSFPIIKGVKQQVKRSAVGPGENYKEGDGLTRTGRVRKYNKASREKGLLKREKVEIGTTYEQWLKGQAGTPEGDAFIKDILGKGRGQAFIDGKFKLGGKFKPLNPKTVKVPKRISKKYSTGVDFVSPNKGEDLSFDAANKRLKSQEQKLLLKTNKKINKALGLNGKTDSVIGAWADGAENSTVTIYKGATYKDIRASASVKGLLEKQKAVIAFKARKGGKARVTQMILKGDPNLHHKRLLKAGIENHTLQPTSDGAIAWVFQDKNSVRLNKKISDYAEAAKGKIKTFPGDGEFIGSWTSRAEGKSAYLKELRAYTKGKPDVWKEVNEVLHDWDSRAGVKTPRTLPWIED